MVSKRHLAQSFSELDGIFLLSQLPLSDLKQIYKRYLLRYAPTRHLPSFLLSRHDVETLLQPTLSLAHAHRLSTKFSPANSNAAISMLQFFSACTVLSQADSLTSKVSFLFELFDLQETLELTKPEIIILVSTTAHGLGKLLDFEPISHAAIEQEVDQIPDDTVSLEQLCKWFQSAALSQPCLAILHLIHSLPRTFKRIHDSIRFLQKNTTAPCILAPQPPLRYSLGTRFMERPKLVINTCGRFCVTVKLNITAKILCHVHQHIPSGKDRFSTVLRVGKELKFVRRLQSVELSCQSGKEESFQLEELPIRESSSYILSFSSVNLEDARYNCLLIEPYMLNSYMVAVNKWHPLHPRVLDTKVASPSLIALTSTHKVLLLMQTEDLSILQTHILPVLETHDVKVVDIVLSFPLFGTQSAREAIHEVETSSNVLESGRKLLEWLFHILRRLGRGAVFVRAVCMVDTCQELSWSGRITSSAHPGVSVQQIIIADPLSSAASSPSLVVKHPPFRMRCSSPARSPWVILHEAPRFPFGNATGLAAEPSLLPIIEKRTTLKLHLMPGVKNLRLQVYFIEQEAPPLLVQDHILTAKSTKMEVAINELKARREYLLKIGTDFGRTTHSRRLCTPPEGHQQVCLLQRDEQAEAFVLPNSVDSACVFHWKNALASSGSLATQNSLLRPRISLRSVKEVPAIFPGDIAVFYVPRGSIDHALRSAVVHDCLAVLVVREHGLHDQEMESISSWADHIKITLVYPSPQDAVGWTSAVLDNVVEIALPKDTAVDARSFQRPKLEGRLQVKWPLTAPVFVLANQRLSDVCKGRNKYLSARCVQTSLISGTELAYGDVHLKLLEDELDELVLSYLEEKGEWKPLEDRIQSTLRALRRGGKAVDQVHRRGIKAQQKLWAEQSCLSSKWREERKALQIAMDTCGKMSRLLQQHHDAITEARKGVRANEATQLVREAAAKSECTQMIQSLAVLNDNTRDLFVTQSAITDSDGRVRFTDKGQYDFTDAVLLSTVRALAKSITERIQLLKALQERAKASFNEFFNKTLSDLLLDFKAKVEVRDGLNDELESERAELEASRAEAAEIEQEVKDTQKRLIRLLAL